MQTNRISTPIGSIAFIFLAFLYFIFPISNAEAKARSTGVLNALVVMVDFSDNIGQVQRTYFNDLMFGNHPQVAPRGSFSDYYIEVSYGQLSITGQVNDGIINWYRMPQAYSYYVNNQYGLGTYPQNIRKLVEDLIAAASAAGLNFGPFDNDNDGYVDALFIVHAGRGAEFTTCTCDIWSSFIFFDSKTAVNIDTGSFNARGNKVYVRDYTIEPEYVISPGDMTIGVFAHEFGHVIGLPDLYDRDDSSEGLGIWSLMAEGFWSGEIRSGDSPTHLDAWSKKKLGWVKPKLASGTISIPQVETNKSVYMACTGTQDQEYFLLENRQKVGFDSYLPGDGLVIYHVDESIGSLGSSNNFNPNDNEWYLGCTTCTSHYKVALEQADGLWDLEKKVNSGDNGDVYPGITNKRSFTARSTPNSLNYVSQATGVSVTKISSSSATMTANVSASSTTGSFVISPLSSSNSFADTAFDGTNYFVIWLDCPVGSVYCADTYGSRVTPCGKVLDPQGIPISTGYSQFRPFIAFDGKNYLVTWTDSRNFATNGSDIYGTFVSPSGMVITPGDFPIITATNDQSGGSIAFDGVNYLVVWGYSLPGASGIMGTRLTPGGTVLDAQGIVILPAQYNGPGSAFVAFNGNNYLVIWDIWGLGVGVQGAILTPAGSVSGSITISNPPNAGTRPSAFGNSISNQFLVVWEDIRNWPWWDIYGQLVNDDGTLNGGNIPITITPGLNEWFPSVSFDGSNYFAVWENGDIYGARINPLGVVLEPNGTAIAATRYGEHTPRVTCSGFNCFVAYRGYNKGWGIYGVIITP